MLSAILLADMMHWDEGGWFWMALMMIVGVIVVVLLIYFLVRAFSNPGEWGNRESTETPLDVAKRRYASGEITKEEFERIMQDLRRE